MNRLSGILSLLLCFFVLCGASCPAADLKIWPYEPVAVWVPLSKKPDRNFYLNAEVRGRGETVVRCALSFLNVVGYNPGSGQALVIVFDSADLQHDVFVEPGRYEVKIESTPRIVSLLEVQKLPPPGEAGTKLLQGNTLFKLLSIRRGNDGGEMKRRFEELATQFPGSPYAHYARVFLAVERFYTAQRVDREKLLGRPPPDFKKVGKDSADALALPLPDTSWPLRGMLLYHIGMAQGMAGNVPAAKAALEELRGQLPISIWSREVDRSLIELDAVR